MTQYIDLSHSLTSTTQIYPSDPEFQTLPHATHSKDGYAVQKLSLGTHTGTHIDAPYHFLAEGETIDKIPLDRFVGEAIVVDLSGEESSHGKPQLHERQRITWESFETHTHLMHPGGIVLINTGWSKAHYQTSRYYDHPYFAPDVATQLLARGVRVVGVDTLNPDETPQSSSNSECPDGFGFHEIFLGAGGLIAENITNLEELIAAQKTSSDDKWIVNLVPLNLTGADGSPVRAFAYNQFK
ncbi:Kynurenine formamidase [Psilocybe cubensis]|uniref:Cyclase n=2 Tax=Psilocybe cubensis TaxID=181762 RepID=A0A8H7XRZ4_PSICU|nr:Kynurenine formamidase [Psilocybe cubensis]KAH9479731.1 Kynurenine formamidase [Psilocybe cubensis]